MNLALHAPILIGVLVVVAILSVLIAPHAFWISALCILAFGLLGVFAGLHRLGGEELLTTLGRVLGEPATLMLGGALVISAASTLDSTFSSDHRTVDRAGAQVRSPARHHRHRARRQHRLLRRRFAAA